MFAVRKLFNESTACQVSTKKPLLSCWPVQIKQQELMARKKIVANPVQMDSIRRSLAEKAKAKAAKKAAKAEAKAAEKAAKKAKKDKKRKRAHVSESGSSDSEDDRCFLCP